MCRISYQSDECCREWKELKGVRLAPPGIPPSLCLRVTIFGLCLLGLILVVSRRNLLWETELRLTIMKDFIL